MDTGFRVSGHAAGESVFDEEVTAEKPDLLNGESDDLALFRSGQDAEFFAGDGEGSPVWFGGLLAFYGGLLLFGGFQVGVYFCPGLLCVGKINNPFDHSGGEALFFRLENGNLFFQGAKLLAGRVNLLGCLPPGAQFVDVGQGAEQVGDDTLVDYLLEDHPGFFAEPFGLVGLAAIVGVMVMAAICPDAVIVPGADAPAAITAGEDS